MGNRGESSPASSSPMSSGSSSSSSSSSWYSSSIRSVGPGKVPCSYFAAGRRRSSSELRRAAIGEACRLEFWDEKGDRSLPNGPLDLFDPRNITKAASTSFVKTVVLLYGGKGDVAEWTRYAFPHFDKRRDGKI